MSPRPSTASAFHAAHTVLTCSLLGCLTYVRFRRHASAAAGFWTRPKSSTAWTSHNKCRINKGCLSSQARLAGVDMGDITCIESRRTTLLPRQTWMWHETCSRKTNGTSRENDGLATDKESASSALASSSRARSDELVL
ncbi:hypothetical protein C8T65DRAFT_699603 [Cerioporus squamosus]|nr:hypothetical protein C8T65DRAFT_699603 [Cerioporus squamosus]